MVMPRKISNIATASLGLMLAASFLSISFFGSDQASAARTCTWDGEDVDDNLASSPDNWDTNTAPVAEDSILFDATSDDPCTFNLALALGSFSIATGYDGTITQAASFSVTSYTQAAGIFTGNWDPAPGKILTDSGAFTRTGGTITQNYLQLAMTGTADLDSTADPAFRLLNISGTVTMKSASMCTSSFVNSGTFSISSGLIFAIRNEGITNTGTIAGAGTLRDHIFFKNISRTYGTVNCPFEIRARNDEISSYTVTLLAEAIFGSTVTIVSDHVSNTITLDLSSTNYALNATGITIRARGILNGRGSVITVTDDWDSANGTFTSGTSGVHFSGASGTIYANTNRFYNMMIETGASTTMQTDVYVSGYFWNNGTFSKGGHTLCLNHDQEPTYSSSPITTADFENAYAYNVNASDQENLGLTYALTTTHPTAIIDDETGEITTPGPVGNGTWSMNVSVTDDNHTVYQNFSLAAEGNQYPNILSHPVHSVTEGVEYRYQVNATDPDGYDLTFNMTTDAYWLGAIDGDGYFYGTPPLSETGPWFINISVDDGYRTVWQNYTLDVISIESLTFTPGLVLTVILGFGTAGVGLVRREFFLLSGLVWICGGIFYLGQVHLFFMILSLGMGFILLMTTAVDYLENRDIKH